MKTMSFDTRRWSLECDGEPVVYITNSKDDKTRKGTKRIWNNPHTAFAEGRHFKPWGTVKRYTIIMEP